MSRHLCIFPQPQRSLIIEDLLLDQSFYRLFLHWCEDVRFVFHYLLAFQVREREKERRHEEKWLTFAARPGDIDRGTRWTSRSRCTSGPSAKVAQETNR